MAFNNDSVLIVDGSASTVHQDALSTEILVRDQAVLVRGQVLVGCPIYVRLERRDTSFQWMVINHFTGVDFILWHSGTYRLGDEDHEWAEDDLVRIDEIPKDYESRYHGMSLPSSLNLPNDPSLMMNGAGEWIPIGRSVQLRTTGLEGLPSSAGIGVNKLQLDFDDMSSDVNLSQWIPTGLIDGAIVSVRKVDTSDYKLLFSDSEGEYSYLDTKLETILFVYFQATNKLLVVS